MNVKNALESGIQSVNRAIRRRDKTEQSIDRWTIIR